MVFKRKFDCLSVGFDFPNIPRAPRSCRRKVLHHKTTDDDTQICAIDLLASLAGKLLEECESSSASSNAFEGSNHEKFGKEIKQEQEDRYKPLKSESSDQGNSVSRPAYVNTSKKCVVNSFSFPDDDGILERTTTSDCKKINGLMPVGCVNKNEKCDFYIKSEGITGEMGDVNVNTEFEEGEATGGLGDGGFITGTCKLEDATAIGVQFPKSVHVDGDLKSPSCMDMTPNGSFARHGNHTNLGRRDDDDDEKLYSYHKLSNKFKSYRSPTIRRIRKSMSSKYWKQVPKDFGQNRADVGVKALYRKRKSCYGYNAWQRETIYKRRRSSDRSSVVTSDGGLSSGSVSKLSEKGDAVKLSIKSFRIPELFIEVPETATVGSLKRTVMEAVSVLLNGGIRVGVLVHGKKVRDDRKTLSQSGISCEENLSSLGFTLESGPSKVHVPLCSEDPVVPTNLTNLCERSAAASPILDAGIPHADDVIISGDVVDKNLELVPYQSDICVEEPSSDSKALVVPLPALEVKALAIVPLNQKPKRTELAQRRTRRPFSVTEVEALVHAVEELGTGRWRDVKLRAFENADHRTYVDLKDKWKTLVHTASISPQQRRGEPVPQDLLDRVLRAYGYWSQRQGKHQARGAPKDPDMNRGGRALESGVSV